MDIIRKREHLKVPDKADQVEQMSNVRTDDFMSMFDPNAPSTSNTPTVPNAELNKSKAVAVMRAKTAEQRVESSEKLEKTDDVNTRLIA
ncbi:hypothetical protein MUCCIDRAFT_114626 [Mucor lusitanicus CBS 277.49]|uniref:Uncharacterized protein n=1 Tax=Mucor lusitanicus CBS 277.49 TaxID=747725 RepID=A0A168I1I4_MUCCL|nr:hypothetical protein MUCCIDRAFT_114626 [Mucor lusitanicus CBS 277.49]